MMRALACVVGIVGLLPSKAEADVSKAWAAAKDNLPANTQLLVAIDVGAVQKTALFPKLVEVFRGMDRDFIEIHDLMKSACGWDPFTVIDGVVFAGDTTQQDGVVAFLQLTIDRAKASKCIESALKALPDGKGKNAVVKQDGDYTVAKISDKRNDTAYFPWVAPNVVMIAVRPDKKDRVDGWFKQKTFGKSKVAGMLGKVDAKAVVAGVFAADKPIDNSLPVTAAYGNWTLGGGKIAGTIVATTTDAKATKGLVDEVNHEIQKGIKRDQTPASVKKVLRSLAITSSGTELTIKGAATEADLIDAFGHSFAKKKSASSTDQHRAVIAKFEAFSKAMCSCKDKACANKVSEDMTKWGTEMAKKGDQGQPAPEDVKKMTDLATRYAECMTKILTPKP